MAASEVSRTFNLQNGSVVVQVLDDLGQTAPHTIYVLGLNGQTIDQAVAAILAATDVSTTAIETAMRAAGWPG